MEPDRQHSSTLGLSEIFRSLALVEHRGTLRVFEAGGAGREELVYFGKSSIVVLPPTRKPDLGDRLVTAGRITAYELEQARSLVTPELKLGEVLVHHQLIAPEDHVNLSIALVLDELFDLFFWNRPQCEFFRNHRHEAFASTENVVWVGGHEASEVRRAMANVEEWEYMTQAIPSLQDVFAPVALSPEILEGLELPPHVVGAASLIDGMHSIEQIADQALLSRLDVSKLVYELLCYGAVEIMSVEDLRELARTRLAQGAVAEAFDLYGHLVCKQPDDKPARWRHAECAAAMSRPDVAFASYQRLLEIYRAEGNETRVQQVVEQMERLDPAGSIATDQALPGKPAGDEASSGAGRLIWWLFPICLGLALALTSGRIYLEVWRMLTPESLSGSAVARTEAAGRMLQAGISNERVGKLAPAFELKRLIVTAYPETEAARRIRTEPDLGLPVVLSCLQAGIEATLGGHPIGVLDSEPKVYHFAPCDSVLLECRMHGEIVHSEWLGGLELQRRRLDIQHSGYVISTNEGCFDVDPVAFGTMVCCLSRDGRAHLVDVGGLLPREKILDIGLYGHVWSEIAVWEGKFYAGDSRGRLVAIDPHANTTRVFEIGAGQALSMRPRSIYQCLLVGLSLGKTGQLYTFNPNEPDNAIPVADETVFGWCTVSVPNLYVVVPQGGVVVYDLGDSTTKWDVPLGECVEAPPLLGDGVLYVLEKAGILHCLELETGAERWSKVIGDSCIAAPVLLGGNPLVASCNGRLVGFDRTTRVEFLDIWRDDDKRYHFTASPTVYRGKIYFAQGDGRLLTVDPSRARVVEERNWDVGPRGATICTQMLLVPRKNDAVAVFGTRSGRIVFAQIEVVE